MEKTTFGVRLSKIMQEKGVTRKALALDANISEQSIGNYINEKRKPDCNIVSQIAMALNVSSDYLLGLSEVPTRNVDIQGINEKTGLSQNAVSSLMVDRYIGDCEMVDFVSYLIANEDFKKLVTEITKLSAFHNTTTDATLNVLCEPYDIDFEVAFKLIVTDMFWEIVRGYNNPLKMVEIHHPITT